MKLNLIQRRWMSTVMLISTLVTTSFAIAPSYSGGTGSVNDPYKVSSLADLEALATAVNSGTDYAGVYFVQTQDIDAVATQAVDYNRALPTSANRGFTPIGVGTMYFKGSYNGMRFTISNLMAFNDKVGYIGLFGLVKNATIKNINLTSCIIGAEMVGGMVAKAESSLILRCSVSGIIKGYNGHGLIAGEVIDCEIKECVALGQFTDGTNVLSSGAIASKVQNTVFSDCFSSASQGLIGSIADDVNKPVSTITNCVAMPFEPNVSSRIIGSPKVGVTVAVTNSYFLMAELSENLDGIGINSADIGNYTFSGLVFDLAWKKEYSQEVSVTTPRLYLPKQGFQGGVGTENNPYLIAGLSDLETLARLTSFGIDFKGVYFKQVENILASSTQETSYNAGLGFYPIGRTTGFLGKYDGNGKTISGLSIQRANENNVGLFAYVQNGFEIKALGLKDCNVVGGDNVGAMFGTNYGTSVNACYASGSVSGATSVGGMAGVLGGAIMRDCYSTCSVDASGSYGGGFIGKAGDGTVQSSYSSGRVTGNGLIGGFAGADLDNLRLTNCYYDKETSGMTLGITTSRTQSAVTGLTTVQFKSAANFTGFVFGTNATSPWVLNVTNRPYLYWEQGVSVGVNALTTQTLDVYPNPARVSFEIKGLEEGVVVEIFNLQGAKVSTVSNASIINVSDWARGVYIVKAEGKYRKLIVE